MDVEGRRALRRIAVTIRELQAARALSTAELAKRSTIGLADLESLLAAESDVSLEVIYLLAGALGVRPGELLRGIAWIPDQDGLGRFRISESDGV